MSNAKWNGFPNKEVVRIQWGGIFTALRIVHALWWTCNSYCHAFECIVTSNTGILSSCEGSVQPSVVFIKATLRTILLPKQRKGFSQVKTQMDKLACQSWIIPLLFLGSYEFCLIEWMDVFSSQSPYRLAAIFLYDYMRAAGPTFWNLVEVVRTPFTQCLLLLYVHFTTYRTQSLYSLLNSLIVPNIKFSKTSLLFIWMFLLHHWLHFTLATLIQERLSYEWWAILFHILCFVSRMKEGKTLIAEHRITFLSIRKQQEVQDNTHVGLLHWRVLNRTPVPHVLEQEPNLVHDPQLPSCFCWLAFFHMQCPL